MDILTTVLTWGVPLIIAIIFHEYGHVFAIRNLSVEGSPDKYLSYNPVSFVDPFGTIILPLMMILTKSPIIFGWARTLYRGDALKNPKRDHVIVSSAGIIANIVLALIAALLLRITGASGVIALFLWALVVVNCFLAVFNLLPIPGFDGFSIISGLLPHPYDQQLASLTRYTLPIFLIIFLGIPLIFPNANIIGAVIGPMLDPLLDFFKGFALSSV